MSGWRADRLAQGPGTGVDLPRGSHLPGDGGLDSGHQRDGAGVELRLVDRSTPASH